MSVTARARLQDEAKADATARRIGSVLRSDSVILAYPTAGAGARLPVRRPGR